MTTASVATASVKSNADKLDQLREQIQLLRVDLGTQKARKSDLNEELEQLEHRIGKQAQLIRTLDRKINLHQTQLAQLQLDQSRLETKLGNHRTDLTRQIRASYSLGQQEYLKLLLNQQHPATVSRTLTYYDYFNRARMDRIHSINQDLARLNTLTEKVRQQTSDLATAQQHRVADKQSLEGSQQQRQQILARLDQQITKRGNSLELLLEDERALLALINQLSRKPGQPPPVETISKKTFRKLKGQLSWPAEGKITARYGTPRKGNSVKWKGILIKAKQGSNVRAVAHGQIIYARWLPRLGLLTILDHGDGYMSLYGHNESLLKEQGEWVDKDEVIASVGNSGGQQGNGLYFEIRHNGKPTNPVNWFENR